MDLELYTPDDKFVMKLDSDEALLGSYPIDDGCRIHVGIGVMPLGEQKHHLLGLIDPCRQPLLAESRSAPQCRQGLYLTMT